MKIFSITLSVAMFATVAIAGCNLTTEEPAKEPQAVKASPESLAPGLVAGIFKGHADGEPILLRTSSAPERFTTVEVSNPYSSAPKSFNNPLIDYKGFMGVMHTVDKYRQARRVSEAKFIEMAKDKDTIILDTRSAAAFKKIRIKGAVHLNFSDFNKGSLAKVIKSKKTRILIYCNNNFISTLVEQPRGKVRSPKGKLLYRHFFSVSKESRMPLNIPTFLNLYGYGYENIYELGPALDVEMVNLEFEGTEADKLKVITDAPKSSGGLIKIK